MAIIDLQPGIPSKRESSARADYVPALCTHRPFSTFRSFPLPIPCHSAAPNHLAELQRQPDHHLPTNGAQ